MAFPVLSRRRSRGVPLDKDALLEKALEIARAPGEMKSLTPDVRAQVEPLVKALSVGSGWTQAANLGPQGRVKPPKVSATTVAQRAHQVLGPSTGITPPDIAAAMTAQGLDWIEPFPPGQPLVPYYGYGRRPRELPYQVGYNITTETRPFRMPFAALYTLWKGYDVATSCTRYAINDLRSMRIRFEAMDGCEDNPVKEITAAKKFLRRPDGKRMFRNWLAMNQRNLWIFDSAPVYRLRDQAGRLKSLKNITPMTIAPVLDYYGDFPDGDAPAFQQFITGIPWDWLKWGDLIYEPFWPQTDSPYGTPPLETVLINANTDIRLQMFFLQMFTSGQVPEAFAIAPEDMTSADDLADLQEQWTGEFTGTQAMRHGLKYLPHGTEIQPYKPQMFDPELAEYVMRRTIAAFGLVPQNLGLMEDVNRGSSDTQMDQQFRISTLPIVGYYEDLLDSVLQDTLTLQVQVRFDTGREKEDRLQEAQAMRLYWELGAVSSSEIREKVLGYPIDPEQKVPLTVMDARLGIIPEAHILAISGDVDPLTGLPKPGTITPIPYTLPGGGAPVPAEGPQGGQPQTAADAGPKGTPTKAYPRPLFPPGQGASKEATDETDEDSDPPQSPDAHLGYGLWDIPQGSSGQGTGATHAPVSVAESNDLRRWQRQSRQRVAKGQSPRRFADSRIAADRCERVWKALDGAETREAVDAAFAKAKLPEAAGIVVQAQDTGRVLLVQRRPDKHDPGEAYARHEFPGGKLTGDSPWTGALREWSEETGATLPPNAQHLGNWTSPDGNYVGYVVEVPSEQSLALSPTGDEVSGARWWDKHDLDDPTVRDKVTETLDRVLPLLKSWTSQPRGRRGKWRTPHQVTLEQFHRHTDRFVALYTPEIERVLAARLTRDAVMKVARDAYRHAVAKATATARKPTITTIAAGAGAGAALGAGAGAAGVASVGASGLATALIAKLGTVAVISSAAGFVAVLSALYADAYLQGAQEAAGASGGGMPPWSTAVPLPADGNWQPDSATTRAAQAVAGDGLAQLLADAGVWVKEIDGTQLTRIGDAIAQGIDDGFPIARVESEIAAILDTTARANLIAETEYTRALGVGHMDVYRRNGVPELRWLHVPGACARCMANVAASPQPTANPHWPSGGLPVHPHERCAIAPTYGSLGG
ncbi:MAG TPA: phage portal protein [Acidimicrobiales bacterium]|nr:phage portal protein [Acidimicrobiales bacterium]